MKPKIPLGCSLGGQFDGRQKHINVRLGTKLKKMEIQAKYNNVIIDFLESRPLISVNALEKSVGMPQSTIGRAKNGTQLIGKKHIFPTLFELAKYGLKIDGYTMLADEDGGILIGKKWIEDLGDKEVDGSFEYYTKERRILYSSYFDL